MKDTKQLLDEWYFNYGEVWNWWDEAGKIHRSPDHKEFIEALQRDNAALEEQNGILGNAVVRLSEKLCVAGTEERANSYDYPGTVVDTNVCPHCGEAVICSLKKE